MWERKKSNGPRPETKKGKGGRVEVTKRGAERNFVGYVSTDPGVKMVMDASRAEMATK